MGRILVHGTAGTTATSGGGGIDPPPNPGPDVAYEIPPAWPIYTSLDNAKSTDQTWSESIYWDPPYANRYNYPAAAFSLEGPGTHLLVGEPGREADCTVTLFFNVTPANPTSYLVLDTENGGLDPKQWNNMSFQIRTTSGTDYMTDFEAFGVDYSDDGVTWTPVSGLSVTKFSAIDNDYVPISYRPGENGAGHLDSWQVLASWTRPSSTKRYWRVYRTDTERTGFDPENPVLISSVWGWDSSTTATAAQVIRWDIYTVPGPGEPPELTQLVRQINRADIPTAYAPLDVSQWVKPYGSTSGSRDTYHEEFIGLAIVAVSSSAEDNQSEPSYFFRKRHAPETYVVQKTENPPIQGVVSMSLGWQPYYYWLGCYPDYKRFPGSAYMPSFAGIPLLGSPTDERHIDNLAPAAGLAAWSGLPYGSGDGTVALCLDTGVEGATFGRLHMTIRMDPTGHESDNTRTLPGFAVRIANSTDLYAGTLVSNLTTYAINCHQHKINSIDDIAYTPAAEYFDVILTWDAVPYRYRYWMLVINDPAAHFIDPNVVADTAFDEIHEVHWLNEITDDNLERTKNDRGRVKQLVRMHTISGVESTYKVDPWYANTAQLYNTEIYYGHEYDALVVQGPSGNDDTVECYYHDLRFVPATIASEGRGFPVYYNSVNQAEWGRFYGDSIPPSGQFAHEFEDQIFSAVTATWNVGNPPDESDYDVSTVYTVPQFTLPASASIYGGVVAYYWISSADGTFTQKSWADLEAGFNAGTPGYGRDIYRSVDGRWTVENSVWVPARETDHFTYPPGLPDTDTTIEWRKVGTTRVSKVTTVTTSAYSYAAKLFLPSATPANVIGEISSGDAMTWFSATRGTTVTTETIAAGVALPYACRIGVDTNNTYYLSWQPPQDWTALGPYGASHWSATGGSSFVAANVNNGSTADIAFSEDLVGQFIVFDAGVGNTIQPKMLRVTANQPGPFFDEFGAGQGITLTAYSIDYSDNGTDWSDSADITDGSVDFAYNGGTFVRDIGGGLYEHDVQVPPESGPHRYWRFAVGFPSTDQADVFEVAWYSGADTADTYSYKVFGTFQDQNSFEAGNKYVTVDAPPTTAEPLELDTPMAFYYVPDVTDGHSTSWSGVLGNVTVTSPGAGYDSAYTNDVYVGEFVLPNANIPVDIPAWAPHLSWGEEASAGTITLTASLCDTVFVNKGWTSTMTVVLPQGTVGDPTPPPYPEFSLRYTFIVEDAYYISISASDTGGTINVAGTVTKTSGYVRSNVPGSVITLVCSGQNKWYAESVTGTWEVEES